jgi:hypothetical protein
METMAAVAVLQQVAVQELHIMVVVLMQRVPAYKVQVGLPE